MVPGTLPQALGLRKSVACFLQVTQLTALSGHAVLSAFGYGRNKNEGIALSEEGT